MTEPATRTKPVPNLSDESLVHRLVESVAAAHPDRAAVVYGETVLSYAELNARADRLAHHLAGFGFRAPSVGLLLPRSAEFVVAALAVLKAGGSYVPLDADYPADRLLTMLDAARCPVVISTKALLDRLPQGTDRRVVCLDMAAESLASPTDADALPDASADSLAYTMFTSGSTGRPKGVMITHRGVVRLARQPGPMSINAGDVVLHVSSVSFDAATYDLWSTLVNGARLVVAPPGRLSTEDIAALLHGHQVTAVLLPTGLFHLMVDEQLPDLARLRKLVVGGDVLSPGHARRFVRAVPDCSLVNAYGPTEVTVATCVHEVTAEQSNEQGVPIGHAMARTQVRVLDRDLRPVAEGTTGQLYAGGSGLARGYLDDPALTAERFVPDPWTPGARLYATGDLVRRRPDGALEFRGRSDDQFKKRGFRIEPGEVQAALRGDPALRDALVLPDGDTAETRRLAAVLLPAAGASREGLLEGVRSRLRARLPDYLVPDVWAVVDALPLTPNGKVDRRALLRLATAPAARHEEPVSGALECGSVPMAAEEAALAAIWVELLEVDRVDRKDDFFDLGGHSLLANKVVAQIRRRLGVALPLVSVFDHPTVAELAELVRAARDTGAGTRTGSSSTSGEGKGR